MRCTASAFAPASKVSATTLACVGTAVQFWPPRPGGTGWVAADAAGSGPDTAPAASTAIAATGPILAQWPASRLMSVPLIDITSLGNGPRFNPHAGSDTPSRGIGPCRE